MRTSSIPGWFGHHAWPLWLLLAVVIVCILLLQLSAWFREHSIRRKRAGITAETFTAQLQQYGFDPVITSSTFRYLREVQLVAFPVLPGDDLLKDLHLAPDDVADALRDLSAALHREYSPGLQPIPPVTVEDLIRQLQAYPRLLRIGAA